VRWLITLLLIIPIFEIILFIWLGKATNIWIVLGLIIATGFLGVILARIQGLKTIKRARLALNLGQMPGREILDGIAILFGALLLMTPGLLTDLLGFLLLLPWTRNMFIIYVRKYFEDRIIRIK